MARFRKYFFAAVLCSVTLVSVPVVNKALPIVRDRECYRSFFPVEEFRERLKAPPAPWMMDQIREDLSFFQEKQIDLDSIEKTYSHMLDSVGYGMGNLHFRILDNKLYKFVPDGEPFSDTDTLVEKALKTLLIYTKIPDCDFILCSMDGVPEPYVPADFFLTDRLEDQAPILAQAKVEMESTRFLVLIPDQLSLSDQWLSPYREVLEANREIAWEDKKPVAVWRGGLSDTGEPTDGRFVPTYDQTPRFALCKISLERPDWVDAGVNGLDSKEMERVAKEIGIWKAPLSKMEHLKAKYLPVMDGHMCTYPGFLWRLISNSVCFKQESNQVQWFYKALQPYVHYIPVNNDMSDLVDKIEWAQQHDSEVQKIVANANEFVSQNLLFGDLYYYYYLVLSEYSKLQNIDFKDVKKQTHADPRWKCIQYRKRLALKKSIDRALGRFHQVSETRSFRAGLFTSEFGRGSKPLPNHSPSFRAGFIDLSS